MHLSMSDCIIPGDSQRERYDNSMPDNLKGRLIHVIIGSLGRRCQKKKKINRKILYEKPSLILIQFGEKKCVCFKLPSWHTMYWVIQTTHKFPTSPWWNYEAVASMYEVTLWCYKCTGLLTLVRMRSHCLPSAKHQLIKYNISTT